MTICTLKIDHVLVGNVFSRSNVLVDLSTSIYSNQAITMIENTTWAWENTMTRLEDIKSILTSKYITFGVLDVIRKAIPIHLHFVPQIDTHLDSY